MPRGQYDRTKTKAQRAAEKGDGYQGAKEAPKVKRAYNKKAKPVTADQNPGLMAQAVGARSTEANRLSVFQHHLAFLTTARGAVGTHAKLDLAINNTLDRMDAITEEIHPLKAKAAKFSPAYTDGMVGKEGIETQAELAPATKKNGAHPAPLAPMPTAKDAPVTFNPPAPA